MTIPPLPPINPDTKVCPHCGHANPAWRSMCEDCGDGLTAETSQPKIVGKILKPKKNENGQCEKCNARPGKPYTFHYLKRIGTGKTNKLSDYRDGGPETVILCDKCAEKHRNKELWQFGLIFLFLTSMGIIALAIFIAVLGRTGTFSALFLSGGLVGTMIGIGSAFLWVKVFRGGLQFSGVSLAMDIWKKWLRQEGYDTFLYLDEYAKIKSRG